MWVVGRTCESGQCGACPAVGDPYDDEDPATARREVWICACDCHEWTGKDKPNRDW